MRLARFEVDGEVKEGTVSGDTIETEDEEYAVEEVELLPPCDPDIVVASGKNYRDHLTEMSGSDAAMPDFPFLFFKPPHSVVGPGDDIRYPRISEHVDYEGELAVVIERPCHEVSEDEALEYVKGYTCLNDVSARDWSSKEDQWARHKGMDTFCPIGPYIQTENHEPFDIETRVNGEIRQDASTTALHFSIEELIASASEFMTLREGDVIATGTPSGVGQLQPGDTVEVEIDSIGTLENGVVAPPN